MLDLAQRPLAAGVQEALRPLRFAWLTGLLGKALALSYRLTGKDRYDDFRLERVHGVPFLVTPSVFNPKTPRTGAFLAAQLDATQVAADAEVLDMGTGSGVCAIFAARHARRVVAVDINPAAVGCATNGSGPGWSASRDSATPASSRCSPGRHGGASR